MHSPIARSFALCCICSTLAACDTVTAPDKHLDAPKPALSLWPEDIWGGSPFTGMATGRVTHNVGYELEYSFVAKSTWSGANPDPIAAEGWFTIRFGPHAFVQGEVTCMAIYPTTQGALAYIGGRGQRMRIDGQLVTGDGGLEDWWFTVIDNGPGQSRDVAAEPWPDQIGGALRHCEARPPGYSMEPVMPDIGTEITIRYDVP